MTDADWREELQELCEASLESRLTPEQQGRLESLVLNHPEARRFYVEYLHQHACLTWSAAEPALLQSGARSAGGGTARKVRVRRRVLTVVLSVAAGILMAVGLRVFLAPKALATLASGKGCTWDRGTLPTEEGARLVPGRLRLAEGLTRIVFDSGAELTLEAPADLELLSRDRCVLRAGRAVAKVPPAAIGFTVETPTALFKDLGTEFGVSVRDAKTADLEVFDGRVDAKHRSSDQTQRVKSGERRRFSSDQVIQFEPKAEFPGPASSPVPPAGGAGARVLHVSTAMGRGKDVYLQQVPNGTNTSDILILVKNTAPETSNYNRKGYLCIDLAAAGSTGGIEDAQLSFAFAPTGMGFASEVPDATFAVYGLADEALDAWDERTMTWKDAPANRDGGATLDAAKTVLLGKFEIPQGALQGVRTISGKALLDFLKRDTNQLVTFIVVRQTPGSGRSDLVHGFANRRHPDLPPPTLRLTLRQ
jgi:ferric-dicitrate binding protein FerR (iron transport regulator)